MFGMLQGSAAAPQPTDSALDPGCSAGTAAPGVVVVCLGESQEGTTAAGFSTMSCDHIANRDPSLDYFVFVLPDAGDAGRTFTSPAATVSFDTGTMSGVIAANAKSFYASAPPAAILEEAEAHADNGTGTPTGGYAQSFVLTHTCPAGTTSSSSSSSSSSTSSSATGGVSGESTSVNGGVGGVVAPNTGSGGLALLGGLLLLGGGAAAVAVGNRRRRNLG